MLCIELRKLVYLYADVLAWRSTVIVTSAPNMLVWGTTIAVTPAPNPLAWRSTIIVTSAPIVLLDP